MPEPQKVSIRASAMGLGVAVRASEAAPVRATAASGQVTFGGAGQTVGAEGTPAIANLPTVHTDVTVATGKDVRVGTVPPPPAPKEQPHYPAEWVPELKMVPGEVRHFAA